MKLGRNDPCFCGSGKKYKQCHQGRDQIGNSGPDGQEKQVLLAQLVNQGNQLAQNNRLDDAVLAYRQAIQLDPTVAEIHCNLAYVLETSGRINESISCYQSAVKLSPTLAVAYFNMARLLQTIGRSEEAAENCRKVLSLQPNNAQAHCNLGYALDELGAFDEALACYQSAQKIDPDLVVAKKGICTVLGHMVPEWHVPMMNDELRNEAYDAALKVAVGPDSNVFEIGTGSGLLAMMAARAGANTVTTCEAVGIVANAAKSVIASNGLADKIKVIAKRSNELSVGSDLPVAGDIMVSEILSSELLGEHVLPSIEDAKRRLLKPNARIIPSAASLMVSLFTGKDITTNLFASVSCGFDLSKFNEIVPRRQNISRNDLGIEFMSEELETFNFDFEGTDFFQPESKVFRLPVTLDGHCLGIVQWMKLRMIEDIYFENHPAVKAPASAWTHCTYLFDEPIYLKRGQIAVVKAAHNRTFPWFSLVNIE